MTPARSWNTGRRGRRWRRCRRRSSRSTALRATVPAGPLAVERAPAEFCRVVDRPEHEPGEPGVCASAALAEVRAAGGRLQNDRHLQRPLGKPGVALSVGDDTCGVAHVVKATNLREDEAVEFLADRLGQAGHLLDATLTGVGVVVGPLDPRENVPGEVVGVVRNVFD